MTTKFIPRLCATLFVATCATVSAASDIPFCAIRLRKPQTDSAEVWKRTLAQFAKHRGAVDEVWFSTGICFPKIDEHRANAMRLAAAIKPYFVWIDDDIRIVDHHAGDRQSNSGWGCHCDFCIGEFSKRERRDWTRPELVEAVSASGADGGAHLGGGRPASLKIDSNVPCGNGLFPW